MNFGPFLKDSMTFDTSSVASFTALVWGSWLRANWNSRDRLIPDVGRPSRSRLRLHISAHRGALTGWRDLRSNVVRLSWLGHRTRLLTRRSESENSKQLSRVHADLRRGIEDVLDVTGFHRGSK